MSSRNIFLASCIALAAPACSSEPEIDFVELQTAATEACKCARSASGQDAEQCRAAFEAEWQTLEERFGETGEEVFACAPVSPVRRCLPVGDEVRCVVVQYDVVGGASETPPLCSEAEAQYVESTYYATYEQLVDRLGTEKANDAAYEAFDDAIANVLNGEPVPQTEASEGCI